MDKNDDNGIRDIMRRYKGLSLVLQRNLDRTLEDMKEHQQAISDMAEGKAPNLDGQDCQDIVQMMALFMIMSMEARQAHRHVMERILERQIQNPML